MERKSVLTSKLYFCYMIFLCRKSLETSSPRNNGSNENSMKWRLWDEFISFDIVPTRLTFKNVLPRTINDSPMHIVKCLVLMLKQFICRCRCQNILPNYQFFAYIIDQVFLGELFSVNSAKRIMHWTPVQRELPCTSKLDVKIIFNIYLKWSLMYLNE